ncbi:MAG: hypothetical protein R6X33_04570 [Candidatus Brocadiia bacterium]
MKDLCGVLFMTALGAALAVRPAGACSIPVFEYALYSWFPADYELVIFHEGALSEQNRQVVSHLENLSGLEAEARLNIRVRTADLAGELPEDLAKLREEAPDAATPRMVLCLPDPGGLFPVWSGPLGQPAADLLTASPARQQMVRNILRGDAAVWVLVESGNEQADARAANLLQTELKRLEGELQLPIPYDAYPPPGEQDAEEPETGHPEFSLVRVSAGSGREEVILTVLSSLLGDRLPLPPQQPVAFPVFGRGRLLDVLIGEEINARNVEDFCWFLTGACQCTVKAQNPGLDLPVAANWDARPEDAADEPLLETETPELTGAFPEPVETAADPAEQATEPVGTADPPEADEPEGPTRLLVGLAAALGVLALCVAAGTLILKHRNAGA